MEMDKNIHHNQPVGSRRVWALPPFDGIGRAHTPEGALRGPSRRPGTLPFHGGPPPTYKRSHSTLTEANYSLKEHEYTKIWKSILINFLLIIV